MRKCILTNDSLLESGILARIFGQTFLLKQEGVAVIKVGESKIYRVDEFEYRKFNIRKTKSCSLFTLFVLAPVRVLRIFLHPLKIWDRRLPPIRSVR